MRIKFTAITLATMLAFSATSAHAGFDWSLDGLSDPEAWKNGFICVWSFGQSHC